MDDKKKEKNKSRRGMIIKVIIISSIFVYFILRSLPNLLSFSAKTVYPEREVVGDNYTTKAIVIRNEEVYKAAGKGHVKYSVKEGERVPSGKHIAELKLSGDASTYDQKLAEINKKIDVLKNAKDDIGKEGSDSLKDSRESIIKEIQNSLQEGDYENAEILKEKLSIYESNKSESTGSKDLINENLAKLELEKKSLTGAISKSTVNYLAKDAGIVSFKIDGYEEVYKYSDRMKYRFTDFDESAAKKNLIDNKFYDGNDPIFKIINNYEWYMILDGTNIKDIDKLKKGNDIRIAGKDSEIVGTIEHKQKHKDEITLLCRFNTDFEEYYDKRFVDVDVIRYKYDGYMIPKKALVEEDNQKGVFVRDISNIIRFRPVEIIYEQGDKVYVSTGDEQNNILAGVDDEPVRTVNKFDEVILNSNSIKEGMILK